MSASSPSSALQVAARAWFVTGTDTGVGKSRVAAALLHGLAARGLGAVGMKPVAAGTRLDAQGRRVNDDVLQLRAAGNVAVPPELDNPYLLPDPLSPHLAARRAGVVIEIDRIEAAFAELCRRADAVVVEGAGGFVVPLSAAHTSADLAQRLGLSVILVVGLRLGCLNHALLTAEALRARGLRLAGWVANRIDPDMRAVEDNIASLRERLLAPLLAEWPYRPAADDALDAHVGMPPLDLARLL